jgi:hypothetical protein
MAVDTTDYNVTFKAPALPLPPAEYNQAYFNSTNNILRLYFNQLDQALRSDSIINQAEAVTWYLS